MYTGLSNELHLICYLFIIANFRNGQTAHICGLIELSRNLVAIPYLNSDFFELEQMIFIFVPGINED